MSSLEETCIHISSPTLLHCSLFHRFMVFLVDVEKSKQRKPVNSSFHRCLVMSRMFLVEVTVVCIWKVTLVYIWKVITLKDQTFPPDLKRFLWMRRNL